MRHRSKLRLWTVCLCFIGATLLSASPAHAYRIGTRWASDNNGGYISWVDFQIDPNLDAQLSRFNGGTPQDAASEIREAVLQFNQVSPFTMRQNFAPFDPNHPNAISSKNFRDATERSQMHCIPGPDDYAVVCPAEDYNTGRRTASRFYFNSGPTWRWNTDGFLGGNYAPVILVSLQEIGHIFGLDHDCRPNSVMCGTLRPVYVLGEDDKQGIIQMYGPRTGFEGSAYQAQGEPSRTAYSDPDGGAQSLQLSPASFELGVSIPEGNFYERFSGVSTDTNSYAYMYLFTHLNDLRYPGSTNAYYRVQNGTKLAWLQYNYRQETISLDIEFTDGTILRDFTYYNSQTGQWQKVRDNYCISVHPAERTVDCFGTGVSTENRWVPYEVDLSPLAGKYIKNIFIAYDNSRKYVVDNFRAYFDTVRIIPPDDTGLRAYAIGSGTVTASPAGPNYNLNQNVTFTANPSANWLFTGWYVDGNRAGWANPLSVTMNVRHTITANFAPVNSFCDVPTNHGNYNAIRQLSARGIIRGYTNGCFGPNDLVQRSQMAAFITRSMDWHLENWGNTFTDRCYSGVGCTTDELWRNVGALQRYGVASGYAASTCSARGYASPCFGPFDQVTYAETISFITRAMKVKGYWTDQGNPNSWPAVPAAHRQDVATFHHYTSTSGDGGVPSTGNWNAGATRAWFSEAQWRALNSYFKVDRTP